MGALGLLVGPQVLQVGSKWPPSGSKWLPSELQVGSKWSPSAPIGLQMSSKWSPSGLLLHLNSLLLKAFALQTGLQVHLDSTWPFQEPCRSLWKSFCTWTAFKCTSSGLERPQQLPFPTELLEYCPNSRQVQQYFIITKQVSSPDGDICNTSIYIDIDTDVEIDSDR